MEGNFIIALIPTRSWILRSGCWAWPSTLWSITSLEWSSCPLSPLWSAISWASTSEWVSFFFWFLLISCWSELRCVGSSFPWNEPWLVWVPAVENQALMWRVAHWRRSLQQVASPLQSLCKSTDPWLSLPSTARVISHSRAWDVFEKPSSHYWSLSCCCITAYISHTTNTAPDLWPLNPECLSLIN